ncbi:hypothetical protein O1611_g8450 [Lasiodiplodia mahajangana]|uniref:Uncharacterized protein n=1 Tax=Lasiodiplodia mahajangana TaxID=1108764 RepID=A0ACC2JD94_9PEZI|nr:hypothetical protein O1611_g8450 [Lasiodiplodia mahajangana]
MLRDAAKGRSSEYEVEVTDNEVNQTSTDQEQNISHEVSFNWPSHQLCHASGLTHAKVRDTQGSVAHGEFTHLGTLLEKESLRFARFAEAIDNALMKAITKTRDSNTIF